MTMRAVGENSSGLLRLFFPSIGISSWQRQQPARGKVKQAEAKSKERAKKLKDGVDVVRDYQVVR